MRLFRSWNSRVLGSIFLFVSVVAPTMAQDRSPVAVGVGQPTLVVSTSKIEQLMANVSYLLRSAGQPEIGGLATMTVNQYSQGLDRSRPIGVAVTLNPAGNPVPVVMLPVSDLKAFFGGLANFGQPEDLGGGLYTMDVGVRPVFAKQLENWLIVSPQEDAIRDFKLVPADLLQSLASRYDVGAKLDVQSIPTQIRDFFIGQIEESYQRASAGTKARLERELEKATASASTDEEKESIRSRRDAMVAAEQVQMAQIDEIVDMIKNTKQVVLGLMSDSANKQIYLEAATEFVPGSKMEAQLARSATAKSMFSKVPAEGRAASISFTDLINPSQLTQMEQSVSAGFDVLSKNIASSSDEQGVADLIKEVKQIVIKSIQSGNVDGATSISLQGGLNIVTASQIADGKQLAATLQKSISAIKLGDSAPQVKFNAYNHQGTAIHLGTLKLPSNSNETVRKIFTDTVSFAIGTADKAVYFAIGSQSEANLKAALDRVATAPSAQGSPMNLQVDLGPVLEYVQSIEPSPIGDAMLQAIQNFANNDSLTINSQIVPRGAVVRIAVEEGVVRAIGAAAKAGQGNNRRGGGF
jgi:hypothetical protein